MVRLVDSMGSDDAIVQAARVSYGKGTKTIRDDRSLIRYLMRHGHTSPFEMCELKFHVRVPMDVWRQWIRHRTASVNEYSTRYSEAIDECSKAQWRKTEGSFTLEESHALSKEESEIQKHAREVYEKRLAAGVVREQARKDLPLSNYTEAYWKIDLHNLLHFLKLRLHPHAQKEIRDYAEKIAAIVREKFPVTWQAFSDYRLKAVTFSWPEQQILTAHFAGDEETATRLYEKLGKSEKKDFVPKCYAIGVDKFTSSTE